MYRSLLVPLDGSPFGEQALPLALNVAQRAGAALKVMHVHVPVAAVYGGNELIYDTSLDALARDGERAYLDGVVRRITAASPVPVTAALSDGPVVDVLHEQALATGADLIVMTTHGRGPLSRFWLGSVADKLSRRVLVPVLLLRPSEKAPDLTSAPVLRHVLIPLDGSQLAERILEPALALGQLMGADYTLIRVVEPVGVPDYGLAGGTINGMDPLLLNRLHTEARSYLEDVADRLRRAHGVTVQFLVAVGQPAAAAILEEARTRGSDLIALETHGRGGFARLMLGSVADKVLRGASMAVLVQRPPAK